MKIESLFYTVRYITKWYNTKQRFKYIKRNNEKCYMKKSPFMYESIVSPQNLSKNRIRRGVRLKTQARK